MTLVLDSTVGGASSNAYGTVLEADAYFEGRPGSAAWSALTTAEKTQLLVGATSLLDQLDYDGNRATTGQRLKHPRSGLYYDNGYLYPYTALARPIQEACFEWAFYLATNPSSLGRSALLQFENIQVGPISITPSKSGLSPDLIPPQVANRIRGFMTSVSSLSGQTELIRG